jgi:hypothetical protein
MVPPSDFTRAMSKADYVGHTVAFGAALAEPPDLGFAKTAQKVLAATRPAWPGLQGDLSLDLISGPRPKFEPPIAKSLFDSLQEVKPSGLAAIGDHHSAAGHLKPGAKAAGNALHAHITGDLGVASRAFGVLGAAQGNLDAVTKATDFIGHVDPPGCADPNRFDGVLAAAGLTEARQAGILGPKAEPSRSPWLHARAGNSGAAATAGRHLRLSGKATEQTFGALGLGAGSLQALKGLRAVGAIADPAGLRFGITGVAGGLDSFAGAGMLAELREGRALYGLIDDLGVGIAKSLKASGAAVGLAGSPAFDWLGRTGIADSRLDLAEGRWPLGATGLAEALTASPLVAAGLGGGALGAIENSLEAIELAAQALAAEAAEPVFEIGRWFAGLSPVMRATLALALVEAAVALLREAEAGRLVHLPLLLDSSLDLVLRLLAVLLAVRGGD